MNQIIPQPTEHIKRHPSGAQAKLARAMRISPTNINDLVRGRINFGPERARVIAMMCGGPVDIWIKGGDIPARRAVVEAWGERQVAGEESEARE